MKARNKRYAAILSVVTVLALALSLVAVPVPSFAAAPTVKTSAFSDVAANSSYYAATNTLAGLGIVTGYPDGSFQPSNTITRAEFATIVVRFVGQDSLAQALAQVTPSFTDAESIPSWAWGYVNAAKALGIVAGYPDGSFRASGKVTQAEALTMLVRAIGDAPSAQMVGSLWPANFIATAASLGISNGLQINASLPATRGEVALMTYNAGSATRYSYTYDAQGHPVSASPLSGAEATMFAKVTNAGAYSWKTAGTVTGVSGNTIYISGHAYTLASNVILAGASDLPSLISAGAVDWAVSGGVVKFISVEAGTQPNTVTGTLADKASEVPTYLTVVNATYPFYAANGTNYFLVFSDGSVVQLGSSVTYSINNGTTSGKTYQDLFPGDTVTVTLDASTGLATSVVDWHPNVANAIVTTTPAATWNDAGTTFQVYYNNNGTATPDYVILTKDTQVTFNGTTMKPADAYAKIQSDVNAKVYPVITVYNNGLNAAKVTITDTQVTGTLNSYSLAGITVGNTTAAFAAGYAEGLGANNKPTTPDQVAKFDTGLPSVGTNVIALLVNGSVQYVFAQGTPISTGTYAVNLKSVAYNSTKQTTEATFDYEGQSVTLTTSANPVGLSAGYSAVTVGTDSNGNLVVTAVYNMQQPNTDAYKVTALSVTSAGVQSFTLTDLNNSSNQISVSTAGTWAVYDANGNYVGDSAFSLGAQFQVYQASVGGQTYYVFVKQ